MVLFLAILIAAITAVTFAPVARNGFVGFWDDNLAIAQNPDYNPPKLANLAHYWVPPPKRQFYVPVTYSLWGLVAMVAQRPAAGGAGVTLNAAWFHGESLLAHVLSTLLVFVIVRRLLRGQSGPSRERSPGFTVDPAKDETSQSARLDCAAFIGALLFGLHPIQVEAVAWASTAYTPLSTMFSLLAVWQYLLFSDLPIDAARAPGNMGRARLRYLLATLSFVLAQLTKPTAITTPLVIVCIEIFIRRKHVWDLVLPLGFWLFLGLPIAQISRLAVPSVASFKQAMWPRVLVAFDGVAFYSWKLVWPARFMPDYGRSPPWVMGHPWVWLGCLVPLAILIAAIIYRRRIGWIAGGIGVFVAGLLPTLGIAPFGFQHYSTVADRYAYPAMLGPAIIVAFMLGRFAMKRWLVPALLVLAVLSGLSILQLRRWTDPWTLFAYNLELNPDSVAAGHVFHSLLVTEENDRSLSKCPLSAAELARVGHLLERQGDNESAAAAFRLAGAGNAAE
jgi:protein O-mannosyl-transferase